MQTKDKRSQRSNINAMILLKIVIVCGCIVFYKKHWSFAAAHSPKISKLYDDILGKK